MKKESIRIQPYIEFLQEQYSKTTTKNQALTLNSFHFIMCPFPGSSGEWLLIERFSAKTVLIPFYVWKKAEACGRLLKAFGKNWLAAYSAIPRKPDPSFTATVICHLHILLKNKDLPRADLLNPAMKEINIGDLYRVYPDSLPMLINLMDYDPNHLKICFEKMTQFIEEQGEALPVHIYKSLRALAKKTLHGASLLAALDALLA